MGDNESREEREWEKLLEEAKKLGLTIEYVRSFLLEQKESTIFQKNTSSNELAP
ncbi:hypothetical protein [Salipaludibacillus daqingensis]|uniref:hypothetical protein n=1 Tax=Salipaludibacillus daqingensis TaxID=3041001 RepID=UPI002473DFC9|nr:hypothetical protein [Salipaludibacillus daqingensis]